MAADDWALLVGIGHYPHTGYKPLDGPANDLRLLKDWLTSTTGGEIPPHQVKECLSPKPNIEPAPDEYPPTPNAVWAKLREIVFDPATGELIRRPNSRLYLYFSGHGFSNFSDPLPHAALYAGNAAKHISYNVCGTKMAQWCHRAAVFGEIILVMDCCRDQKFSERADEAHFDDMPDSKLAKQVRKFEVYAVPYDGKAQERSFKQEGGETYGVVTYAFVNALKHASPQGALRGSTDIKQFIEGVWGSLVGVDRIEAPEFVLPLRGDIHFSSPTQVRRRLVGLSAALATSAELQVIDHSGELSAVVMLDPVAGQQRDRDVVTGAFGAAIPFDGLQIELNLPVELYELVLKREGLPDSSAFLAMMGDDDVIIQL